VLRLGSVRFRQHLGCRSVAFSPTGDVLVSGGMEQTIRIWDRATGKALKEIELPEKRVNAVAISPDGKHLAAAAAAVVYLWDIDTGREIHKWPGHKREAISLSFSAKGDRLAVGDHSAISIREVATGKLLQKFEGTYGMVEGVALTPDGKTVAGSGLGIWDVDTGKLLHELPAKKPYGRAVVFSKDGKFLITAGNEGIVVWETASGNRVDRSTGPRLGRPAAALSPDGATLAVADESGLIYLWDWTGGKEIRRYPVQTLPVHTVAFSCDGKSLASGDNWGAIHLWDVATGQQKLSGIVGHQEGVTDVAYVPAAASIATTAWDGSVRIWDALTGKETLKIELPKEDREKTNPVNGYEAGRAAQMMGHLALSPDGKLVAASRWDSLVMVWDASTGKEVQRYKASRLAFSGDNKLIACLEYGARNIQNPDIVRLYDRETGKHLRDLRGRADTQWFDSPVFLHDSKSLLAIEFYMPAAPAAGSKASEAQFVIWDVATGKLRRVFPCVSGSNHQLRLSPDGRTIATRQMVDKGKDGFDANTVILWETASGGRRTDLVGHKNWVDGADFSPDGRLVASTGMDGTCRLWDLFPGKEIAKFEGHRGWIGSVRFAPDGKTLVTGSTDSTALVWDLSHLPQRAKSAELSAADLESCWKGLAGDARAGYLAIGRLIGSPKQAVAMLTQRLQPAPKGDAQRIAQLIEDLGSDQFKTRDAATKELEKIGEAAGGALEKALTAKVTLEIRQRLERLLELLDDSNPGPEKLRQIRAVESLEQISTEEARRLLDRLVDEGAPGARLTREAEAALRRMKNVKNQLK
jgi:WD40 repeat protein